MEPYITTTKSQFLESTVSETHSLWLGIFSKAGSHGCISIIFVVTFPSIHLRDVYECHCQPM